MRGALYEHSQDNTTDLISEKTVLATWVEINTQYGTM